MLRNCYSLRSTVWRSSFCKVSRIAILLLICYGAYYMHHILRPRQLNTILISGTQNFTKISVAQSFAYNVGISSPTANVKSSTYYENLHSPHPNQCADAWDSTIKRDVDGTYTISVPIQLGLNSSGNATVHYVPESIVRKGGGNRLLRFEDLSEINDTEWLSKIDGRVYDLYPQDLHFPDLIHNLSTCKKIEHKPLNQHQFRFYNVSSTVCSTKFPGTKPDLVVVVKSAINNFEKRNRIRDFIQANKNRHNFTVDVVFSIGLSRRSDTGILRRDGFNVTLDRPNSDEQIKTTAEKIESEMNKNSDIILGDYEDTYFNLTYKMFHSFQWAAHFCRKVKPIFLFIDDDHQFNFTYMQANFMSKSREERNNLAVGNVYCSMSVFRNDGRKSPKSKWDLSKREMPWPVYPCYFLGFATLLGYNVVRSVSMAMPFTKVFHIDDAYLGIVMRKCRISMKHSTIAVSWRKT